MLASLQGSEQPRLDDWCMDLVGPAAGGFRLWTAGVVLVGARIELNRLVAEAAADPLVEEHTEQGGMRVCTCRCLAIHLRELKQTVRATGVFLVLL